MLATKNATKRPRPLAGQPVLVPLLSLACCLVGLAVGQQQQQQQQQPQQPPNSLSASQEASVNLGAILRHQEALAEECARYKAQKERELQFLLTYNAANEQVQLPEPMPMKVPAICLLFLAASLDQQLAAGTQPKLDLVNWIFDEDSIQMQANNITKRQTLAEPPSESLLADYLLNPRLTSVAGNDVWARDEEAKELHDNIDNLVSSDLFKSGVKQGKVKIAQHLSPVILIPGLLGSRLQARTDKASRVNIFCSKQSDWTDMWLSLRMFLPIAVDCWLDNVRLEFDPSTGYTRQPGGVQARVPDFGSVESVRHLDVRQPKLTSYYQPLIEHYEQLGYTADVNLLAAPYDFRLAPQQLADYFGQLRQLIEGAQSETNGAKKVTLVCHSMGCTHALIFLRQQSAAWRQNRVRKLIALSSPWAGTAKALKALLVGDQLDLPLVSELKMRRLARTYPSIAYLLPQVEVFERATKNQLDEGGSILVQTPQRTYKVTELAQLMSDLKLTRQYKWFQEASALIKPLEPLADLNVDCIHSINIPTPETLIFRNQSDFPDGDYELIKGDGDGTVNLQSLSVCELWTQLLPGRVRQKIILNTNHLGVIGHKTTLDFITEDVLTN